MTENKESPDQRLTLEHAFKNIVVVCRSYQGTWEQHQIIEKSLEMIQAQLIKQHPQQDVVVGSYVGNDPARS